MIRHDEIQNAYKYLGKESTFYDGMITCSTIPGSAVCKKINAWTGSLKHCTRQRDFSRRHMKQPQV